MDSIFRLTQQVLQFVHGSAYSSSSPEIEKEMRDILDDLELVKKTSDLIKAVLADAEERAVRGEKLVKQWLTELHHLNYRAADLLGLYEYEVAAQQIRDEEASATAAAAAKGKRKLDQVYNSSPLSDPSFRREFALGIRKFQKDFDEINKAKEALRFDKEDGEKTNRRDVDMIERLPTGSEPVDDLFFGREEKLQELIGYLLTDCIEVENDRNSKYVPVIALVGMGGVGKTTLAQHAFNDPKVCEFYSRRGWVCVSDNFNVQRLTRSTLEAFRAKSNGKEFSVLQTRLKDVAKEEKFLLVLDDVWNENMAPWETFYSSLRAGAKGSKIIITTRSTNVADTTQAMKCIDVSCLSDEHAWTFFQTVVFGDHGNQHELDHPALTDVGKKITERCKGLPLLIKVLGRFLRCYNKDVHIWYEVLESELLQPLVLGGEVNEVLGPLILSYLHLPARVKPCFVLSCVFPKDTEIRMEQLIDLWIAHGLVEDCNEKTGMLYIQNLVASSFFEIHKDDCKKGYIMIHDIIHGLAMHLSRDNILHKTNGDDGGNELLISQEVQHAFISFRGVPAVHLKFDITDTSGLRTLHVKGNMKEVIVDAKPVNLNSLRSLSYEAYSDEYFSHEFVNRLKNLRHLDLANVSPLLGIQKKFDAIGTFYNLRTLKIDIPTKGTDGVSLPVCICNLRQLIHLRINGIRDVPDSIGCLTKLYKLHLSLCKIKYLPDTISKLVNLKEMDLSWCYFLIKLPESIGNLKALRVLNLERCPSLIKLPASIGELKALEVLSLKGCSSLEGLPVGIKKLRKLQRLEVFSVPPRELVADDDALGIGELRELVCIWGWLDLVGLENVATQEEAKQSELHNKRHIFRLHLEWADSPKKERDAQDELKRSDSPDRIDEEELKWSADCIDEEEPEDERVAQDEQVLQGLRPHANLENLEMKGWNGRRLAPWLGDTSFINLTEMWMNKIPNCKSLTPIHQLPSLKHLDCWDMPSLLHLTPPCSDSDIRNSCFPALERLELNNCRRLVFLAESMPLLERLGLERCDSVRALPCTLDSLPSLNNLYIERCVSLRSILFDNLPALEYLHASDCSRLQFSDSTVFPSLTSLYIIGCPQPVNWCRAHRQSKLAHLPDVYEWSDGIEIF